VEGEFLRNRIPIDWLAQASDLSGKALAVGLAAWFLSGLKRSLVELKLTGAVVGRFAVNEDAKRRAVAALEGAGLLRVRGRQGVNPVVSILPTGGRLYLGPRIPLPWLTPACGLKPKDLATGLAIWFLSGLRKSTSGLELTGETTSHFRLSRSAKSRGVDALEGEGLIAVERRGGKPPVVSILGAGTA
jgi:hypothetical protein